MPISALKWKDRRALAESPKATPEALAQAGRELADAGHLVEAANFFHRAADRPALERLRIQAVEEGDFFLHAQVCRLLERKPDRGELSRLAGQARESGFSAYEAKAAAALAALDGSAGQNP
ncbi:MAG: hypothetical protein LBU12_08705 [Deltaproteobacteria bacterium]|nr:hypothetical protein [Deltaproteobacteria bacterium]